MVSQHKSDVLNLKRHKMYLDFPNEIWIVPSVDPRVPKIQHTVPFDPIVLDKRA